MKMHRKKPPRKNWRPQPSNWNVSSLPPLLQELYQATRETKEQAVLARLAHAKELVEGGADLKASDPQGRTALHWAIFGSSYNVKPSVLVAYEEIADSLIQRGVEINKQDGYQDTALDYLLYSPSFEMQTLLIGLAAPKAAITNEIFFEACGWMIPRISYRELFHQGSASCLWPVPATCFPRVQVAARRPGRPVRVVQRSPPDLGVRGLRPACNWDRVGTGL
jgi:ankyrin repeat protein